METFSVRSVFKIYIGLSFFVCYNTDCYKSLDFNFR